MTRRLSANRLGLLHGPGAGTRLSCTEIFLPRVDFADTQPLQTRWMIAPAAGILRASACRPAIQVLMRRKMPHTSIPTHGGVPVLRPGIGRLGRKHGAWCLVLGKVMPSCTVTGTGRQRTGHAKQLVPPDMYAKWERLRWRQRHRRFQLGETSEA